MQAELNFVVNRGERLIVYPSEGGGREESKSGEYENRIVEVEDGRSTGAALHLDVEGFLLTEHHSQVADFYNDEQLSRVYDGEIETLLERLSGATEVLVFDHTRRSDDPQVREWRKIREPAGTAHNDYTEMSAPRRVRDLLGGPRADRWLAERFAIVNVWRPIKGPVARSPLVLCDARSVVPEDLVVTERRARERIGEIYQLAFNPAQRWVYFPAMTPDEVLVFKCFDSAQDGRARFAPHSALRVDAATAGAPRESIESRALVRFP